VYFVDIGAWHLFTHFTQVLAIGAKHLLAPAYSIRASLRVKMRAAWTKKQGPCGPYLSNRAWLVYKVAGAIFLFCFLRNAMKAAEAAIAATIPTG
jgi:hypothetical protein